MSKIDTTSMGINEFAQAIDNGQMTAAEVLAVLDARIAKRKATGKSLITKVVQYRNDVAAHVNSQGGLSIPAVDVPTYPSKQSAPAAALPTDVKTLAKHCISVVGAAGLPTFIAELSAAAV